MAICQNSHCLPSDKGDPSLLPQVLKVIRPLSEAHEALESRQPSAPTLP